MSEDPSLVWVDITLSSEGQYRMKRWMKEHSDIGVLRSLAFRLGLGLTHGPPGSQAFGRRLESQRWRSLASILQMADHRTP